MPTHKMSPEQQAYALGRAAHGLVLAEMTAAKQREGLYDPDDDAGYARQEEIETAFEWRQICTTLHSAEETLLDWSFGVAVQTDPAKARELAALRTKLAYHLKERDKAIDLALRLGPAEYAPAPGRPLSRRT